VSIDYRLLHHFRISQRREMAARGELPARFQSASAPPSHEDEPERPAAPATPVPRSAATSAPQSGRGQVLTHLLNEDR
jgi:hypothetical protein